jgi:hypothetical protein
VDIVEVKYVQYTASWPTSLTKVVDFWLINDIKKYFLLDLAQLLLFGLN